MDVIVLRDEESARTFAATRRTEATDVSFMEKDFIKTLKHLAPRLGDACLYRLGKCRYHI